MSDDSPINPDASSEDVPSHPDVGVESEVTNTTQVEAPTADSVPENVSDDSAENADVGDSETSKEAEPVAEVEDLPSIEHVPAPEPKVLETEDQEQDQNHELPPVPEKETVPESAVELSEEPVQPQSQEPAVDVVDVPVQYSARLENIQIFQKAFNDIFETKEVKKNEALKAATQKSLDSLANKDPQAVHIIFDTLKVLCELGSQDLKSKAVDVFAKLFDYTVFDDELERANLTDAAINVISSCFEGEGTDEKLEVQVVKALVQCILCMPTHGLSLLNAVRQIFNVTIMSLSQDNQGLAQGSLTQVVGAIFQRVSEFAQRNKAKAASASATVTEVSLDVSSDNINENLTLEKLQNLGGDSADIERVNEASDASTKDEDLAVKDAFLIFRVICKLASKDLDADNVDMKSHAARQKVFTLHLIHTILKDYIDIFLSKHVILLFSQSRHTRLVDAIRPALLQALSRNATSSLAPVFELSIEIFWLLVANLRSDFKQEISIFLETIYFPIGEIKTSTPHHKRYLLAVIERLCNDSRCLIEFYLNYDCVSKMPDICDMLINYLTKLALARVDLTPAQQLAYRERKRQGIALYDISKIGELNSAKVSSRPPEPDVYTFFPLEYALKVTSLNCFVAFLRSLHSWAQKGLSTGVKTLSRPHSSSTPFSPSLSCDNSRNTSFVGSLSGRAPEDDDGYEQFESQKQRKKLFSEGIRRFAQKPAKAIKFFIENGFIPSDSPEDITSFIRENEVLDKAAIGEYLGGAEDGVLRNAFFSTFDYSGLTFVDALRSFLQLFRLPGEGQKVDRYMQNFADRYVDGNPSVFEDANDAYILAYSTTMLNTDQHSRSLRSRMTLEDFVNMNSGDNFNIPRDLLEQVFHEVQNNEIKLLSEQSAAAISNDGSMDAASVGFFSGRDVVREAYNHASREMSSKTEMLVRSIGKRTRTGDEEDSYHVASNVVQVKAIFNQVWMSILAGLTGPFKEYDDEEVVRACLEGLKFSIKIACIFDMEDAKKLFVNALIQFQNLANIDDIKQKNVEAMYLTLDLAIGEGNFLQNLWYAVLALISQLERLQLIANGIDQSSIPDVSTAKLVTRQSTEAASRSSGFFGFARETTAAENAAIKYQNQHLSAESAALIGRTELSVAMDRVFTNTSELSGEAIKDFVTALRQVVTEEIESSGQAKNPRLFSLQKVVDICYYNMGRVRFEWIPLWAILGDIFNTVGCHSNLTIDFFALDSLKQLSLRFLSIEELAHFKFQKEFLKPFHYIISNNKSTEVKEMVIDCVNNMVLVKADQIKSGWKTIFEVLTAAAKEHNGSIVKKSFDMAVRIKNDYLGEVSAQDSLSDLVACFTEFAKNEKYQKYGLLSVEILTKLLVQVAKLTVESDQPLANGEKLARIEILTKLWFPILFGFYDIIMNGEEFEVRLITLTRFFDVLHKFGGHFDIEFWELIYKKLVAQIFGVLSDPWSITSDNYDGFADNDKMSFWVSTTLVQALNSLVSLYTHYFDAFVPLLPELMGLLSNCICQDHDTVAKTGMTCLEDFILKNALRLSEDQWKLVVDTFALLFANTTPRDLLVDPTTNGKHGLIGNGGEDPETTQANIIARNAEERARDKTLMVLKCIRQLMLIETVLELTKKEEFLEDIPDSELIRLSQCLFASHEFAREFNDNIELRKRLYNTGVIEKLPTLLKQETIAAAVFLNIMFKLYCDDKRALDLQTKQTILESVVPLSTVIVQRYCAYSENTQQAYIMAWRHVIKEIFEGYVEMDAGDFNSYAPDLFRYAMKANNRSGHQDVQVAIVAFMARIGDVFVYGKGNN